MEYIIFIFVVSLLVAIFILRLVLWLKWFKQFRQETSFHPKSVDDYTVPRYVYENYHESSVFEPQNGRVIGYRISPQLVINNYIHNNADLELCDGYLLPYLLDEKDEVKVLKKNLDAINSLRKVAGDPPFDLDWFWIKKNSFPVLINIKENLLQRIFVEHKCFPALLKY